MSTDRVTEPARSPAAPTAAARRGRPSNGPRAPRPPALHELEAVAAQRADAGDKRETDAAASGTIDDLEDDEERATVEEEDRPDRSSGPRLALTAHLSLTSATREAAPRGGKHDAVKSTLTVGSSLAETATPKPKDFGVEKAKYKLDSAKWTHDAAAKSVAVTARVFLDIAWGTRDRGRTNVPSAADAVVTKDSWPKISPDLNPDATGRVKRTLYWSKLLTEKHEKFHATDDIGQATGYLPTVVTWLNSQTVSPASVGADVAKHLETARVMVKDDGWAHYRNGGENRAYADGKASYKALVDAMDARAAKEGW